MPYSLQLFPLIVKIIFNIFLLIYNNLEPTVPVSICQEIEISVNEVMFDGKRQLVNS